MSLWSRMREASGRPDVSRSWFEQLVSGSMQFAGSSYPLGLNTLYGAHRGEDIGVGLQEYVRAVMMSPPAFGAQLVRSLVLSQARFQMRDPGSKAWKADEPPDLRMLRRPWPKGSTGELITKMEWHEGLAGNAFVWVDRAAGRLRMLRPDWVTIVIGSEMSPEEPGWQLDAEVLGYAYRPGGRPSDRERLLLADQVIHWAPLPDPMASERGMSWLTPIVREIVSDIAATEHKVRYFANGATPNLVVNGIPAKNKDEFEEFVDMMEASHTGVRNAYKTLYLVAGSDATVVGSHMKEIDYSALQGASETRISVASRVPAPVLSISEGLQGSSLNAGNYGQSRRNFGDIWLAPTLQSLTEAFGQVLSFPPGVELWPNTSEMPFLLEDGKDAADIEHVKAQTIRQLVDAGYTPESVVAAVEAQDMGLLVHSGLYSVQLQPPGAAQAPSTGGDDED